MKVKKLFLAALASLMVLGQAMTALAAETTITLDDTAKDFAKIESDDDFHNMEPGETKASTIRLENNSAEEMSFYISGEILSNIADTASDDQFAVYDLRMYKGSLDESNIFFNGTIGSKHNKWLEDVDSTLNYLQDDTLLATLKKGESTTVMIAITLDGDSTGSAYENKSGEIRLNIKASVPIVNNPETVTKKVTNTIQKILTVKTGDGTPIALIVAAAAAAVAVVVVLLIVKRKRDKKEE